MKKYKGYIASQTENVTKVIQHNNSTFYLYRKYPAIFLNYYVFELFSFDDCLIVRCYFQIHFIEKTLVLQSINTFGEDNQSKGYASIVMERVIEKAKKLNLKKIILPTDDKVMEKESFDCLFAFYKKHGASIDKDRFYIDIT
ncbi:hypothetical protein [Virgibacillus proomii]|uniref:hypothetical protein n=1 Tax=Virgibacillus proomii TaxID=84407 RepID=UPI001C109963|nr:hypothetical protein [Virgibacillus proomii]MBU5267880.1 hypothetical protein [Virgibacillus proomii]